VTRRVQVLVAAAALVAGLFGAAGPVAAVPVNAPPVAVDDPSTASCWYGSSNAFALPEDKLSPFIAGGPCNLLANDTDSDGTVVDWELVTVPQHGDVTNELPLELPGLSSDFAYTPDPDYFTLAGDLPGGEWLSDSFTYRAIDDDGAKSAPATVRLWIAPVNDAPTFTGGPSSVTSGVGAAYSHAWATNVDPGPGEGYQTVHFNVETSPGNDATLFSVAPAISSSGVLSWIGAPGKTGSATFSVTAQDDGGIENYGGDSDQPAAEDTSDPVSLTIKINGAPVAVDDPAVPACNPTFMFGGAFPIAEDWGQFTFAGNCGAIANDTDADGSITSWQVDDPPSHGDLEWLPIVPGVFGYTPDPDYSTIAGDQPGGQWISDSFTYHVIDNDGASSNSATYRFWIAPVNDAPSFTVGPSVVHGSRGAAYDQPWATAISPGPNESTQTVHFEITNTNLHGSPSLFAVAPTIGATGRLSFTLAPGQLGSATVTVVAKDDGGLESYSGVTIHPDDTSDAVTFDIVANEAPAALPDAVTVDEDQATAGVVDVLANDGDVDLDSLTVTGKTDGAKGVVTVAVDGLSVSYKPNPNAYGSDTFTYTISDGHGGTDTASVAVTITPENDAPLAVNDGVVTPFKVYRNTGANPIAVLANDTWLPDAPETLRIVAVSQGTHGAVAITGGGTGLTYSPTGLTLGLDQFTYTISDGHGGTNQATVRVTVSRDVTLPKATITSLTKSRIVGSTKLRVALTWTLTDSGSGLRKQLLQRRTDGGSWVTVSLASVSTRKAAFAMSRGHTYTFRIRGTDRAGNVGLFVSKSIRI
jgi:large repetitive protein